MPAYNPFSLEEKTVLITGASSGIGAETAVECSRLGATVIISGRNESRLQETFSRLDRSSSQGHQMVLADLTDETDIARLIEQIDCINGLVLCAGKGMTAPFSFCSREKYEDLFNINFFAPVELLRLLIKKKKLNREASVVFVSSVGGNGSYKIGNAIYGASKAALDSTMKFCAKELAGKRIRVNSVCPGMVDTEFVRNSLFSEEQLKVEIEKYPLKRFGNPLDIADGIVYLLSDASSWVTGIPLVIDGGYLLK